MPVFAVIPADSRVPVAVFMALADARAWAAVRYGRGRFTIAPLNLVRVLGDHATTVGAA
jgi:hypothetical protein